MRFARVPVVDEYTEDGETVVLLDDGRVLALTEVPSAVLALLAGGSREVTELTGELVAQFGEPPAEGGSEGVVRSVLDELSELGLVVATRPTHDL